jgi:hypothetical protein
LHIDQVYSVEFVPAEKKFSGLFQGRNKQGATKKFDGLPWPWQLTGPGSVVQAKFGQYLQNAKEPRSISQTEKAIEWEQVSFKEQVLPMPDLIQIKSLGKNPRFCINSMKN